MDAPSLPNEPAPKAFRVGGRRYAVAMAAAPLARGDRPALDHVDAAAALILISPDCPVGRRLEALLGGLCHAHAIEAGRPPSGRSSRASCGAFAAIAAAALEDLAAAGGVDALWKLTPGRTLGGGGEEVPRPS